jgi:hypothetical protein
MPVEGSIRRSDTIWRLRFTRSPAAGKTQYGGFSNKYLCTQRLLRSGDSIHVFDQPLRESISNYGKAASCSVPRVIATAHCSYRRPPINVNHWGRVRMATTR